MTAPQPPAPVGGTIQKMVDDALYAAEMFGSGQYSEYTKRAARDRLITAIAALEAQLPQWQPIETVPKDGTHIIAYWSGYKRPVVAWWNQADQAFESLSLLNDEDRFPDYWMPLPPSPTGPWPTRTTSMSSVHATVLASQRSAASIPTPGTTTVQSHPSAPSTSPCEW